MNIKRVLIIAVPSLLIVGFVIYIVLGGFKQPEIKIAESPGYTILGKRFTGTLKDRNIKRGYQEVQDKYRREELKGIFAVLHYVEPDEKDGKIDLVVGVIVNDTLGKKPSDFNYYVWKKGPIAQATILSHYSVAPSPDEINEVIQALAKTNGYKTGQRSLEKYASSRNLVVESPLVKIK